MNKKAEATIIVGISILLLTAIIGGLAGYNSLSHTRYVIDTSTNLTYDLAKCSTKNIPTENLIRIGDLNDRPEWAMLAECSK